MLAHAAQINSTDNGKEADNYFKQAKGLLDSLLDIPSLSTVVALCLMSLYEPKHGLDYRSSALCYSAMAFRIYNQLCNTRHFDESRRTYDDGDDNGRWELWKRVSWGCYCLDKLQGVCFGASWMLRLDGMVVDLPRYYWPNEDQEQLECFVAFIKLTQMAEQSLCPDDFWKQPMTKDYSNALQLDQVLLQWLQALPVHFQWTPLPTPSSSSPATVPKDPPRTPWIAQLHLVFNMIELRILAPFASPSASTNSLLQQRCVSVATYLIQLTQYMADQPTSILSYAFTGTATMMATRVHLMNCGSYQDRHSRDLFRRGMHSLSSLVMQGNRTIPGVDAFLGRVKGALHIGGDDSEPTLPTGTLLSENGNANTKIDHMYLTGSEQNAAEVLSHAFGTSSTFSSSSPLWQHQAPAPVDPLDFLETTAVNDIWNHQHRMAPSSVDALLNKSRFLVEDHRLQDFTNGGGGLVMSHSKLNDPLLLSTWMMRHTKDLATDSAAGPENSTSQDPLHPIPTDITFMTPSTASQHHSNNNNSLFWPPSTSSVPLASTSPSYVPNKPSPVTTTAATTLPTRSFGQYMNIGLGVYASAHQHHNDVIRQHIPGVAAAGGGGGGGNNARPVLLTHQGQVIVAPSGPFGPNASSSDGNHGGANAL
jgi:hypothetical protein